MREIVLASSNKGKLQELSSSLEPLNIELHAQSDYSVPDAEETGLCFVENAILKARNATKHTGLPAIADDSGLLVDALNGEPGIYSARFAGKNANSQENMAELISRLKAVTAEKYKAHFYCCIVFLKHEKDPAPMIFSGSWHGEIILEKKGEKGFGYDPIFYLPELKCSAAELNLEQKNEISHRGKALKKLIEYFKSGYTN